MNTVINERIDNANDVIILRVPKGWRGGTIHVEMTLQIEETAERMADPDYSPEWKIGDTIGLVGDMPKVSGTWPEGFLKSLYGSAPDLVIDKSGPPPSRVPEWLD